MSRHITLAAFLITLAVVVPAAWHVPDADIAVDGPRIRPKQATLEVGDATIAVDLDRGVLMSGGRLKATLVATADTPRKIALDVRALEDNGIGEGRVENPPTEVARRRITVEAAPGGGKPTEVAFELRPRGARLGMLGMMEWYDIEVAPVRAKRARVASDLDEEDEELESVARVGAVVWGGNNLAMKLEAPASIPAGDAPFHVKVRVKNTARKPMQYVDIRLGGPGLGYSGMEGLTFYGDDSYEIEQVEASTEASTDDDDALQPGAERVYEYKVTPKQSGADPLGLLVKAGATVVIDEERNKYRSFGAMEAVTISRSQPEPASAVAGK